MERRRLLPAWLGHGFEAGALAALLSGGTLVAFRLSGPAPRVALQQGIDGSLILVPALLALGVLAISLPIFLAATRAEASIGTVLSSVPWMMRVGTLNATRSPLKSVVENDFKHSSVAFRLACIAMLRAHSSNSSLTGCEIMPTPKKFLKKPVKNWARSSLIARAVSSNEACSVPAGLSLAFSRYGSMDDMRAVFTTDLPACRAM